MAEWEDGQMESGGVRTVVTLVDSSILPLG